MDQSGRKSPHRNSGQGACSMLTHNGLVIAAAAWLVLGPGPSAASVVISSQSTQNVSCSGGICAPTAKDAVLNVSDLESMLASGNVEVTTTGSGVQAGSIAVDAALTWSSTNTLAIDAYDSIAIDKPVSVAGLSGVTITTNDGGSGGTFSVGPKGRVTFQNLASDLTMNGRHFTLVNSLPALASAVSGNRRGSYALAGDYDAKQDGTYKRPPITKSLTGTIEGLGNVISHLSIDRKSDSLKGAALIAEVGRTGIVADLRLVDIRYRTMSRKSSYAGGLVSNNYGYLSDDEVSGTIDAEGGVGAGGSAGGLANYNAPGGVIIACSADVDIVTTGNDGVGGGFVETNFGTITLSRASGSVSAEAISGGFVSFNEGTLSEDFATGLVNGGYPGGFAGSNSTDPYTGTITNSYATGAVGNSDAAGFVQAQNGGLISDSYSTGAVSNGAGGFACTGSLYVSDDYWDTTTSGTTYGWCYKGNAEGTTGLTSEQLRSGLPTGFDPKIWAENPKINNGFPYLIDNPPQK